VASGLAESDPSSPDYEVTSDDFKVALKESPRSIGSDGFRARIDELYQKRLEKHTRPEDVSFRQIREPLSADDVLTILSEVLGVEIEEFKRRRHSSPLRALAARYLIRYAGQSQRDVADLLDVGSGSAVCKQLNRLPEKLSKDRRLRRQVKQLEAQLSAARRSRAKGNGT